MTLLDIGELVRGMTPAVVVSLLRSKAKIDDENRAMAAGFAQDKLPSSLGATLEDLERFLQNALDLTGVFARQAVEQKKLDPAQIKRIEREKGTTFNLEKAELRLTESDKLKQEAAKAREATYAAKQAEEAAAKLKSLQDRLADRLPAIEQAKQAQLAANEKAAADAQAKAEAALLSQMTETQKQRFQADKTENLAASTAPPATPADTPTNEPGAPSPQASSEARLASLEISGATLSPAFSPNQPSYTAIVNGGVASVAIRPAAQDPAATITVNGQAPADGAATVALAYGSNAIGIRVVAPDRSLVRDYSLVIARELLRDRGLRHRRGLCANRLCERQPVDADHRTRRHRVAGDDFRRGGSSRHSR